MDATFTVPEYVFWGQLIVLASVSLYDRWMRREHKRLSADWKRLRDQAKAEVTKRQEVTKELEELIADAYLKGFTITMRDEPRSRE